MGVSGGGSANVQKITTPDKPIAGPGEDIYSLDQSQPQGVISTVLCAVKVQWGSP